MAYRASVAPPSPAKFLPSWEFCTVLRGGGPPTSAGPCPACQRPSDCLGDHALNCAYQGERITRHNALRDALHISSVSAALGPRGRTASCSLAGDSFQEPSRYPHSPQHCTERERQGCCLRRDCDQPSTGCHYIGGSHHPRHNLGMAYRKRGRPWEGTLASGAYIAGLGTNTVQNK